MTNSYDDPTYPNRRPERSWMILVMVAIAFIASFLLMRRSLNEKKPGGEADYSWRIEDLDGKTSTLEKYKGKPIFLNVWATWCGPCRQEMPSIARLAANPKLKDVAFLCVSQDQSMAEVKGYLARVGAQPMTMLHSVSPAPGPFQSDGIPATFVIAPDGRIVRTQIGSIDWDDPKVVELLEGLSKG